LHTAYIPWIMGLSGGSSDAALEHDLVESWRHEIDKAALAKRKAGDWIFIPRQLEHAFINDFSAIEPEEALYFQGEGIPTVRVSSIDPDPWDESGTMASFSAASEVATLREFFREQKRPTRGQKSGGKVLERELPPAPSGKPMEMPQLSRVGPLDHLRWLRSVRDESHHYHRWSTGADLRLQWKSTPAFTRTKLIEGDTGPGDLDTPIAQIDGTAPADGDRSVQKTQEVRPDSDLRRYTVNVHPALARAMAKMVASGEKARVIELMAELAPGVAAKFQDVTGRRCVGLSVHFDSELPHWNIWHSGMERVHYPIGEKERIRYRRTAFNLNSSGNMLAWHRTRLAFERLGKDFKALSSRTVNELEKGLKRAMDRQGRPPGDWTINEEADRLLEDALRMSGKSDEIEAGFAEFVENEVKRYRDGGAGREPKDGRKLAALLRDDESVEDAILRLKRAAEIPAIEEHLKPDVGESLVDAALRVAELAGKPQVEKIVERVVEKEVVKEVIPQNLLDDVSALRSENEALKKENIQLHDSLSDVDELLSNDEMIEILTPAVGESAVMAAKRVVEENENLRNEIAPLRRLAELAKLLFKCLAQGSLRLGGKALDILEQMASIVGETFSRKTMKPDRRKQKTMHENPDKDTPSL
jgi:hypothetical protein